MGFTKAPFADFSIRDIFDRTKWSIKIFDALSGDCMKRPRSPSVNSCIASVEESIDMQCSLSDSITGWVVKLYPFILLFDTHSKQDESMARRHLMSSRPLLGRSLLGHLILVTKRSRSWSWMTVKILGHGHGQGQPQWLHLMVRI